MTGVWEVVHIDDGVMKLTNKVLSPEEQKEAQKKFEDAQARYNATHDPKIVWFELMPIFREAIGPSILKQNHYHFVQDFEEKVKEGTLNLVARYINRPDYNYGSLATLVYFAAKYVSFREDVKNYEQASSWEELEELRLRQEHIIEEF